MNESSNECVLDPIVRFLFHLVWRRRLRGFRLVRVTGWRSCLYDTNEGQRVRATWLFCKSNAAGERTLFAKGDV